MPGQVDMTSAGVTLLELPDELLDLILRGLCGEDLARISHTCKQLHDLAASEDVWRAVCYKEVDRAMLSLWTPYLQHCEDADSADNVVAPEHPLLSVFDPTNLLPVEHRHAINPSKRWNSLYREWWSSDRLLSQRPLTIETVSPRPAQEQNRHGAQGGNANQPRGSVSTVAIEGSTMFCVFQHTNCQVWHLEDRTMVRQWRGHNVLINVVAIKGKLGATGAQDRRIKLWDLTNGTKLNVWVAHQDWVTSLAISGGGDNTSANTMIVSGSKNGGVKVWDLDGNLKYRLTNPEGEKWVWSLAMEEGCIWSGSWKGNINNWNIPAAGDDGKAHTVAAANDDHHVQGVRAHHDQFPALQAPPPRPRDGVEVNPFAPLPNELPNDALGAMRDVVVQPGDMLHPQHWGLPAATSVSKDSSMMVVLMLSDGGVVTGSKSGDIHVFDSWDVTRPRVRLVGHTDWVWSVACRRNTVVSGSSDKTVRVWDLRTGECRRVIEGFDDWVMAVSLQGSTIVSVTKDAVIQMHHILPPQKRRGISSSLGTLSSWVWSTSASLLSSLASYSNLAVVSTRATVGRGTELVRDYVATITAPAES